jgi:hypothetical protein
VATWHLFSFEKVERFIVVDKKMRMTVFKKSTKSFKIAAKSGHTSFKEQTIRTSDDKPLPFLEKTVLKSTKSFKIAAKCGHTYKNRPQ